MLSPGRKSLRPGTSDSGSRQGPRSPASKWFHSLVQTERKHQETIYQDFQNDRAAKQRRRRKTTGGDFDDNITMARRRSVKEEAGEWYIDKRSKEEELEDAAPQLTDV